MTPRLSLAVQFAVKSEHLPTRPQFRRWLKAALVSDAEVTLRIVGSEEGLALNRDYRGKDYPTNVLTFPLNDDPLMGDIVLCAPVVEREALDQGKLAESHYAHLVVHGMLHLQGHDHETEVEAATMEALETQILAELGYPDPYLVPEHGLPS